MLQQALAWNALGTVLLGCSLVCLVAFSLRSVKLGAALEAYRRSEERYQLIAENCSDVIWVCTLPGLRFAYLSPAIRRQRGFAPQELIGKPIAALTSNDVERQVRAAVAVGAARFADGDPSARFVRIDAEVPRKDGRLIAVDIAITILCDRRGRPRELLGISRDVTDRKAAEHAVRRLAFHDPLTELPNRRLLEDRLGQAIARARRERVMVALLFIDLDGFKQINDERGHVMGDWLLQRLAERLRECVRSSDTVARVGGDEFAVLLPDVRVASYATMVAEKLRVATQQPVVNPDGTTLEVSCSTGIALYPVHAHDARSLERRADEAMYRAKGAGKNGVWVWGREVFESRASQAACT